MVYHRKTLKRYISHLFYVHTEMGGSVAMFLGAGLEIMCGAGLGWDNPIAILAFFAADIFAVIALCMLWSVYRWERRHA